MNLADILMSLNPSYSIEFSKSDSGKLAVEIRKGKMAKKLLLDPPMIINETNVSAEQFIIEAIHYGIEKLKG